MSTYSDLIEAIKARVDLVPDVGSTHAYQRFSSQMPDYLDHFMVSVEGKDQIRGWVITLSSDQPIASEVMLPEIVQRTYQIEIYGMMELEDGAESELEFLDLAEAVMDSVEGGYQTGVVGTFNVEAISMRTYQVRMFGNVLCHYCEIMVPIVFDHGVHYVRG